MKSVILAAIIIVSVHAFTDEQKEKLKVHHRECTKISGVKEELILKAKGGEFVNDEGLKKHLLCVSKRIGLQNESGDIVEAVIRLKLLPELKDAEVVNKLIQKCAVKKPTPEETAFNAIKCYSESTQKRVIFA